MIFFDTTAVSSWKHASGIARVSRRLEEELGKSAYAARWPEIAALPARSDWILTPELFSEAERPGFTAFLEERPCRIAAIYHDAIPIKHPDITWPKSVVRHPSYMKLLARFDRVWAVSAASRAELLGFWKWQGISSPPRVDILPLGSDWKATPRQGPAEGAAPGPAKIVSLGILEPRKNQTVIIQACAALRREGVNVELHLVGRVNPHFGSPMAKDVAAKASGGERLYHHQRMDDAALFALVRSARATAFASIAEGCGLPLLESLWLGVPCLCSDIAPMVENAEGGGCAVIAGNSLSSWTEGLRRILADDAYHHRLAQEAARRALPTWAGAARMLREALV